MNILKSIKSALTPPNNKYNARLKNKFEINRILTKTDIARIYDVIYGAPEPSDPANDIFKHGSVGYDSLENTYDRILTIIPGDMQYNGSSSILNAWDFKPQVQEFNKQLGKVMQDLGVNPIPSIPQTGVKFFCQEITMTESVSNQYGDNTLSSINNIMTQLVGDYAYMSNGNWNTFTSMLENNLKAILGNFANPIISAASGAKNAFSKVYDSTKHALNKAGAKTEQTESIMKDLFSGYKADLPKIWKNSTNNKQLTVKISLYSTIDNNEALTDRVTVPYGIILLLSSPRSSKSYLYKWPFVVKAKLPGFADIQLGAITDVQITKGGTQGVKSYNEKYLAIDISLTITPLYNTQFIVSSGQIPKSMLTVNQELKMIHEYFNKERWELNSI